LRALLKQGFKVFDGNTGQNICDRDVLEVSVPEFLRPGQNRIDGNRFEELDRSGSSLCYNCITRHRKPRITTGYRIYRRAYSLQVTATGDWLVMSKSDQKGRGLLWVENGR
jgi:hypothetical protein